MNSTIIETERLRLVEPGEQHIDSIVNVLNDPEIYANTLTIPYPYTRDDAVAALERFRKTHVNDEGMVRFIVAKDSGELVGSVGFEFKDDRQRAELGYAIGRAWWGKGFATEAAEGVVRHAFEVRGVPLVTAHAMLHNPASSRVLEKLGFEYAGVICGACRKEEQAIDAHGYTMTREQWMERCHGAS